MITAHWFEEAQKIVFRNFQKRHYISKDFVQINSENNLYLVFLQAVVNYNKHIRKVNENAQQRA